MHHPLKQAASSNMRRSTIRHAVLAFALPVLIAAGAAMPPMAQADQGVAAWLWMPPLDQQNSQAVAAAQRLAADEIDQGDLYAINTAGSIRLLGQHVTDVLPRNGQPPLAILPARSTGQPALQDLRSATTLIEQPWLSSSIISPNGGQVASRIPSPEHSVFDYITALQITNMATGITNTLDIFDTDRRANTNHFLGWGPHQIYGDTHMKAQSPSIWWVDPTQPQQPRRSFPYGEHLHTRGNTIIARAAVVSATTDRIITAAQRDILPPEKVIISTLTVSSTLDGSVRLLDACASFSHLGIAPDGRHALAMCGGRDSAEYDLRLYSLDQPRLPQVIHGPMVPWDGSLGNALTTGTSYVWSPSSQYVAVITSAQYAQRYRPDAQRQRYALVFRTSDGAQLDAVPLPSRVGSIFLSDSLRLLAIGYQADQASLQSYNLATRNFSKPISLGTQTPIIVYAP